MPLVESPPIEHVIEKAERIVHEAQLAHIDPPPPDPPDDFGESRRRPERRPWSWFNTVGVMLAVGGFVAFFKSTDGFEAAASYASMLVGLVLIESRDKNSY